MKIHQCETPVDNKVDLSMLVIKTLSPVSNLQNLQLYLPKKISYKNFWRGKIFLKSPAGFEVMTIRFAVNTITHCATLIGGSFRERNYSLNYTRKIVRHNMEMSHTTLKLYTV